MVFTMHDIAIETNLLNLYTYTRPNPCVWYCLRLALPKWRAKKVDRKYEFHIKKIVINPDAYIKHNLFTLYVGVYS